MPENPLKSALSEWVIGSEDFLKRMVTLAESQDETKQGRIARRTTAFSIDEIMQTVAASYGVKASQYMGFRSPAAGRKIAALLCRRFISSTLAELSEAFGLRHPDSSANLVRRAKKREAESTKYRRQVKDLESKLMPKTENQG